MTRTRSVGAFSDGTPSTTRRRAPNSRAPGRWHPGRRTPSGQNVQVTDPQVELESEPDAAPRARRFAAATLAGASAATVSAAELVVTELVTNAVLHGQGSITLRIERTAAGARIEVSDRGRNLPLPPRPSEHAMTGRGLSLVTAYATAWGVEPSAGGGKTVWAEVSDNPAAVGADTPAEIDLGAAAVPGRASDDEPLHTVRIGSVPTDLLLAAKAHVDNVVREFTLLAAGTSDPPPPPGLRELIETITHGFAFARTEIKRQAIAAAERGDAEADLVLTLPASAAEAGEDYLAALDETDRYARAARLLTLESPPVHRAFRRWYVQGVVDALRALAAGRPHPPARTFRQALADEVTQLSAMREAADRLSLLQRVTGELSRARTVEEIASAFTVSASRFLGALSARVYLLREDMLCSLSVGGGSDDTRWAEKYEEFPLDADLPGALVARTGQPVMFWGRAQLAEHFPHLAEGYSDERCLHIAPLIVGGRCIGLVSLTFPLLGLDEPTQGAVVATLADTLAQTLERAVSLERLGESNAKLAEANERLAFLARASVALSRTLDYQATLDELMGLVIPRLADWCSVQLVEDGGLRTVAIGHVDPQRVAAVREFTDRWPPRAEATTGSAQVVRTGRSELYPEVPAGVIERAGLGKAQLALVAELGAISGLVVPLTAQDKTLGTLSLVYSDSGRRYGEADVPFAEDIARRAALALRSAATFREQTGRLADVRRVADAAQRAILAPPPARIGPVALAARYVGAAAEAQVGGDLYEVIARPGSVRLLIGDVRGKGLSAVRMATIVLGEFRAVAAELPDLPAIAARLDRRLRPHLGEEDFVTALLAEIADDGTFTVASCGHPPAYLLTGDQIIEVDAPPALPLGLGADVTVTSGVLAPGDRLLLYTDGAIEARDDKRRFIDFPALLQPALQRDHAGLLDAVLDSLRRSAGNSRLNDDLALLIAEYRG